MRYIAGSNGRALRGMFLPEMFLMNAVMNTLAAGSVPWAGEVGGG